MDYTAMKLLRDYINETQKENNIKKDIGIYFDKKIKYNNICIYRARNCCEDGNIYYEIIFDFTKKTYKIDKYKKIETKEFTKNVNFHMSEKEFVEEKQKRNTYIDFIPCK